MKLVLPLILLINISEIKRLLTPNNDLNSKLDELTTIRRQLLFDVWYLRASKWNKVTDNSSSTYSLLPQIYKSQKKGAIIKIDPDYNTVFETCRNLLMNDPIRHHSDFPPFFHRLI